MKTIKVAAAIIHRDNKYFATQRGYGEFEGMWEFPGGKIEPGESPEAALRREIQEELGVYVSVERLFHIVEYDYPSFHLTMHCYLCTLEVNSGASEIELREHKSSRWLAPASLDEVEWLPADREVIEMLKSDTIFSF